MAGAIFVAVCLTSAGVIGCGLSLHCAAAAQLVHVSCVCRTVCLQTAEAIFWYNSLQPHAVCLMSLPE